MFAESNNNKGHKDRLLVDSGTVKLRHNPEEGTFRVTHPSIPELSFWSNEFLVFHAHDVTSRYRRKQKYVAQEGPIKTVDNMIVSYGKVGPFRGYVRIIPRENHLYVRAELMPESTVEGWLYAPWYFNENNLIWIYPWLSGDKYECVRNIVEPICTPDYRHIWTVLAGVPMAVTRWEVPESSATVIGGISLPLHRNYRNDGFAYDRGGGKQMIAVGCGRPSGVVATTGNNIYEKNKKYLLEYQIFIVEGGFRELAGSWIRANNFAFDRLSKRSLEEALQTIINGRGRSDYYFSKGSNNKFKKMCGYRHGTVDSRVSIYRQPWNAFVDYLIFRHTGNEMWKQRCEEQLEFLLISQNEKGWFFEDWNLEKNTYTFEGLVADGQASEATDITDNAGFGPRPDHNAMACDYLWKCYKLYEIQEGETKPEWLAAINRCVEWIINQQASDGSLPMTVAPDGKKKSDPVPMGRLLVAFEHLGEGLNDARIKKAKSRHERWVIKEAFNKQKWWGSHKDTGTVTDYGGLQSFIQYCTERFLRTRNFQYLTYASECTYFNFFEHCPKQLEWLKNYSKWGIMEQANWMQYDIDQMDTLIYSTWYLLGELTGDLFVKELYEQSMETAMQTLHDDPNDPAQGAWDQYLVDPYGAVAGVDTPPKTGGKSVYTGSIVCSMVEDLMMLLSLFREKEIKIHSFLDLLLKKE